jgi:hypothetical protein
MNLLTRNGMNRFFAERAALIGAVLRATGHGG